MVKNSSAMQETWVQSLGLEDPLEKGLANMTEQLTHFRQYQPNGLPS